MKLSASAGRSQENDWLSHTASVGASRELFKKNTEISMAYSATRNKIGRAMDPIFEKSLIAHTAEFSIGQLLDRKSRAGLAYTFQDLRGFQSSPYRFVRTSDGVAMAEVHPRTRRRHALTAFVLRSLPEAWLDARSHRSIVMSPYPA